MKTAKIGSSIKVANWNGREEFLTVEAYQGDIGLFRGCTLVTTRARRGVEGNEYFNLCGEKFWIKG